MAGRAEGRVVRHGVRRRWLVMLLGSCTALLKGLAVLSGWERVIVRDWGTWLAGGEMRYLQGWTVWCFYRRLVGL